MTNNQENSFVQAEKREKKVKLFLWGSWGVGKTTIALQFPKPVLFDLDGGADLYGGKFKFDVLKSANLVDIKNAIAYLINNEHEYDVNVFFADNRLLASAVTYRLLEKYWKYHEKLS